MATATLEKIKDIDIKRNTFKVLSDMAGVKGMDIKKYIENLLDKMVADRDLLLFNDCVKDNPDCWKFLTDEEQSAFEKEMGI